MWRRKPAAERTLGDGGAVRVGRLWRRVRSAQKRRVRGGPGATDRREQAARWCVFSCNALELQSAAGWR